ncbi:MAG: hypothetical protein JOZ41_14710 [Chloroflexi bacterium]|nr:hypothetical protein [Chloroflexota bacterium]
MESESESGRRPVRGRWGGILSPRNLVAALIMVVGVLLASGILSRAVGSAVDSAYSRVDGIPCETSEGQVFHIHAHLTLLRGGQSVAVPANVGIPDGACFYWLHTHDDSGVIHIEAPKTFRPRLGNFFDIWGQPLSRTRAASLQMRNGLRLMVFVNLRPYTGNPRAIPLSSHTDVTVELGPPFEPPERYDFASRGY